MSKRLQKPDSTPGQAQEYTGDSTLYIVCKQAYTAMGEDWMKNDQKRRGCKYKNPDIRETLFTN